MDLKDVYVPQSVRSGDPLALKVILRNEGFASLFNPRPIYAVLQGGNNRYEIPLPNVDPRRWESGKDHTFDVTVTLPSNAQPGTYKLGMWLPDATTTLRNNPAYSVRFANANVWDPSTGINVLTSNLSVQP